jgi:hypothetical protein
MVKPMPQRIATPAPAPSWPGRQCGQAQLDGKPGQAEHPDGLAQQQADGDAHRHGWVKLSRVTPASETPALAKANSGRMA